MKFKKEYLKLGIVERLEKLRVIYYGEPLLGISVTGFTSSFT